MAGERVSDPFACGEGGDFQTLARIGCTIRDALGVLKWRCAHPQRFPHAVAGQRHRAAPEPHAVLDLGPTELEKVKRALPSWARQVTRLISTPLEWVRDSLKPHARSCVQELGQGKRGAICLVIHPAENLGKAGGSQTRNLE